MEDFDNLEEEYKNSTWEYDGEEFETNKELIGYIVERFETSQELKERFGDDFEGFYLVTVSKKIADVMDRDSINQQTRKVCLAKSENVDVGDEISENEESSHIRGVENREPSLKAAHDGNKLIFKRV